MSFIAHTMVYKTLIEQVKKIDDTRKNELANQLKNFKDNILEKSILKVWLPRELRDLKIKELFAIKRWAGDSLLGSTLNDE